MHIAIEGNIGSGKTTLAVLLAQHYKAQLILEEFADNHFLPKFYQDPERYALPVELSFLTDRYNQLHNKVANTPQGMYIISDYLLDKSKLFASINLLPEEYILFNKLFSIIKPTVQPPDILIFLRSPINILMNNIRKRGRSFEQGIQEDYLKRIEEMYETYIQSLQYKLLIINNTTGDFMNNPTDLKKLTTFLDGNIAYDKYELSFNNL